MKISNFIEKVRELISSGIEIAQTDFYQINETVATNVEPDNKEVVLNDLRHNKDQNGREWDSRTIRIDLGEDLGNRTISINSDALKKTKFDIKLVTALRSQGMIEEGKQYLRAF